jgi:hypothetical protein
LKFFQIKTEKTKDLQKQKGVKTEETRKSGVIK